MVFWSDGKAVGIAADEVERKLDEAGGPPSP
jgi:hypothetical protein